MTGESTDGSPRVVVLDIEGTVAPIAFVHDVLFPYARARLGSFLERRADEGEVAGALADLEVMAPGAPPVETLHALMDQESKVGPLKAIQGGIWEEGFAAGDLHSEFYPDVAPTLAAWHAAGVRLAVFSSGSERAQRLLLSHVDGQDLTPLFDGFFDTRVGGKREAASFAAIARGLGEAPAAVLFLSDVEAELDAAAKAGLLTCQIVRPEDGTVASDRHETCADLPSVAHRHGLPGAG